MSTAIQQTESHALQPGQMNREQIELLKTTICRDASDDELRLFSQICAARGLDPFAKQIYAVKLKGVMTFQTSIDGFRLIAERTGKYGGQLGPFWCGPDGEWKDVWLSKDAPAAARVGIIRHDFKETLWGVARLASYTTAQNLWLKMPEVMIAKCAESNALRKAFPQELSGLYSSDEMEQADNEPQPPAPSSRIAAPVSDQLPARPWSNFAGMLHCFQEQRERVGDAPYYETLMAAGVEHANGFKATEAAIVCYNELNKLPSHAPKAVTVIDAEVIDDAQEPEPTTELGKHLAKGTK